MKAPTNVLRTLALMAWFVKHVTIENFFLCDVTISLPSSRLDALRKRARQTELKVLMVACML